MKHAWVMLLAMCVLCASAWARLGESPVQVAQLPGPTAGSEHHGWLVLPIVGGRGTLYHLPEDSAPGSIRMARLLARTPTNIAADGDGLVMVFAPEAGAGRQSVRPVRRINTQLVRAGWYVYSDPLPEPPLPGEGILAGFAGSDAGPIALFRAVETGEGKPVGSLVRLRRGQWQPMNMPLDLEPAHAWTLVTLGSSLTIIERANAGPARVWSGMPDDDGSIGWSRREVEIGSTATIVSAAGQIVVQNRTSDGVLVQSVLRGEHVMERGRVTDVPSSALVAPVGERINYVWEPGSSSLRLLTKVVTVEGVVLHSGSALAGSPVSSGEVQVLALLLSSLAATVVLFLMKSERGQRVPALPTGTALAEPSRRLLAAAVDVLPGLLLAGTIWGRTGTIIGEPAASAGIWPLLVVGTVTMLHTGLGEWRWGRTLGKAMLGCRTVQLDGSRLSAWQAWGRSLVKVLCPAVALWIVLSPYAVHFWSLGTIVVLDDEPTPGGGADDGEGTGRSGSAGS